MNKEGRTIVNILIDGYCTIIDIYLIQCHLIKLQSTNLVLDLLVIRPLAPEVLWTAVGSCTCWLSLKTGLILHQNNGKKTSRYKINKPQHYEKTVQIPTFQVVC